MPLPCSKLEARCCTVYADRPSGCRTFVCHLGRRLELGDATFTDALKIVREAQRRIEVLRAAMPGLEPVVQRATREASLSKGHDESALDALQAVHDWLDEWIHWPEGPRTGT